MTTTTTKQKRRGGKKEKKKKYIQCEKRKVQSTEKLYYMLADTNFRA
jgi:hypothetical protein